MKAYKVNELQNFKQPGAGNMYDKLGIGQIPEAKKLLEDLIKKSSYDDFLMYEYIIHNLNNIELKYSEEFLSGLSDPYKYKKSWFVKYAQYDKFITKNSSYKINLYDKDIPHKQFCVFERFPIYKIQPKQELNNWFTLDEKININYGGDREAAKIEINAIKDVYGKLYGHKNFDFFPKDYKVINNINV